MLGPRFLQMQGPNHSASGEDERRPTDQGEPVSDNAVPDSALAVTLGAATLSGLLAGLGVWVASPRELRALSYGLFAGASVGDGTVVEYCIAIADRKRAEAALRESEERFRLMVQTVQDHAIFLMDPEGNVAGAMRYDASAE